MFVVFAGWLRGAEERDLHHFLIADALAGLYLVERFRRSHLDAGFSHLDVILIARI